MKVYDLIRRGGRSLLNAKARTFLTSMAIAVGGFTLTLTFAASAGANNYAEKLVSSNFDPSELIVAKDFKIFGRDPSGFSRPQEYDETLLQNGGGIALKRLTADDLARIAEVENVTVIRPQYQLQPQFITTPRANAKKYVATLNAYTVGQRPELQAGTAPSVGVDLAPQQVLIPESFVSVLGFSSAEQAVGQSVVLQMRRAVTVSDELVARIMREQGSAGLKNLQPYETKQFTYTIRGVTKKTPTNFASESVIYLGNEEAKKLNEYATEGTANYQKFVTAFVRIKDGTNPQVLKAAQDQLSALGYNVQSSEDTQESLSQIITILQGIVVGFGIIALIASVFGIINTQYISVLERTREIGLQKALGMRQRSVAALFTFEAAWIGLLGGSVGAACAVGLGVLINPWLSVVLGLGEGNYLLLFHLPVIVALIAALIGVAMLAGLLPALKAAKLDPIEALRTE